MCLTASRRPHRHSSIVISDEPLNRETNYRTEFVVEGPQQPATGRPCDAPAPGRRARRGPQGLGRLFRRAGAIRTTSTPMRASAAARAIISGNGEVYGHNAARYAHRLVPSGSSASVCGTLMRTSAWRGDTGKLLELCRVIFRLEVLGTEFAAALETQIHTLVSNPCPVRALPPPDGPGGSTPQAKFTLQHKRMITGLRTNRAMAEHQRQAAGTPVQSALGAIASIGSRAASEMPVRKIARSSASAARSGGRRPPGKMSLGQDNISDDTRECRPAAHRELAPRNVEQEETPA